MVRLDLPDRRQHACSPRQIRTAPPTLCRAAYSSVGIGPHAMRSRRVRSRAPAPLPRSLLLVFLPILFVVPALFIVPVLPVVPDVARVPRLDLLFSTGLRRSLQQPGFLLGAQAARASIRPSEVRALRPQLNLRPSTPRPGLFAFSPNFRTPPVFPQPAGGWNAELCFVSL